VQEGLVDREDLTVIGLPCDGVVSQAKLRRAADMDRLESAEIGADHVEITAAGKTLRMALDAVMPDKCLSCAYPNALLFDRFVGDPMEPPQQRQDPYARLDAFEALPLEERFDFWKREMSRCIRCYACRNACPLCVCRDYCLAESRQPHYQSQESDVREKWFFQLIHATHLAGRCTECGECERACPMGIPVLLFKKKLGRIMTELFQYEAGLDVSATAPLLTFQAEEENIVEKQWL
jgi:ferredoxin